MNSKTKICYVVAPDGQVGGGMGRVKDYILSAQPSPDSNIRFLPLVTRDHRGAAFSLLNVFFAILIIWWAALRGRVALVHVNFGDNGSAVRKSLIIAAAALVRVPVLLHLHAVELERQFRGGGALLQFAISLPFRMSTSIAVLGMRWKKWLTDDLGIPAEKIDVLWNGVPVERQPQPAVVEDADSQIRILFLGNLMERKGVTDLLHAMAQLAAYPQWQLLLAGGGDIDHYRRVAAELGIETRVQFMGWLNQADVRKTLSDAHMLVLPSYEEGLPLVILEALGLGTPVVCSPVGSIPEVLEEGKTVLFAQAGDRTGLSAAIKKLFESRSLRDELSVNGLELYAQLFSMSAFLGGLSGIYEKRYAVKVGFSKQD